MYFRQRQIRHSILEGMQYVYFRERQSRHSILEFMQYVYFRQRQIRHNILEGMQSLCIPDGSRFAKAPWRLGCSPYTGLLQRCAGCPQQCSYFAQKSSRVSDKHTINISLYLPTSP